MRGILVLTILVASLLSASTWHVFGNTWDEPEHLAAGLELLDRGKYEYDTEHPPIARVLIALGPWLAGAHSFGTPPPDGTQEGIDILYAGGDYARNLTLARLGALPFLTLLLVCMWLWARQVASSPHEALLGVVLLASVPPIIGHAALAALDVPGTATTLLALYLLQCWLITGAKRHAILFGLATGLAVGTKFSAVPFLALAVGVLALMRLLAMRRITPSHDGDRRSRSLGRLVSAAGLMVLAGALPIMLAYGRRSIDLTLLPPRFGWVLPYLFRSDGTAREIATSILSHVRLPEAFWDVAEGIVALKAHNDSGHLSYLLGHVKPGGWWYFYLVDLAVKTPLPLLILGGIGLVLLARDGWRRSDTWRLAPPALFVTLLTFASVFSRINIGIRHVLILYPFLALGAAYAIALAWRYTTSLSRAGAAAGRTVLVGLVLWQLSPLWSANPDYFPYFNELVREPSAVLVDSDLDWGQDLWRLERVLAERHVAELSIAYRGTADLRREPLPPFTVLPPGRPVTGWIAVSAMAWGLAPEGYGWLAKYQPVERVGKSIKLFYVPPSLPPPQR